jgi:nucleoporin NUP42
VSAFSRDTEKTGDMTPSTSGMPNQFPPGTKIPQGWSYEDPWSWTFPSLQGNEAGKMEDRLAEIFRSDSFSLGAIPSIPPPIEMRA